jgi:hypothetical protein
LRTRRLINALTLLALAASLGPSAGQALAVRGESAAGPTVRGTQCRAGETVLYSCRFGRAVGSACLGAPGIHYRFGPPGRPAIDIANDAQWSNVHIGFVTGGGGGRQTHLRFTAGRHHYILFEGRAGALTDVPGRRWSGIVVLAGDDGRNIVATHECLSRPILAADWHSALSGSGVRDEVAGGPFDAWY